MLRAVSKSLQKICDENELKRFWDIYKAGDHPIAIYNVRIESNEDKSGRTVIDQLKPDAVNHKHTILFGNLIVPDSIRDIMIGQETSLVLVIDEFYENILMFESDIFSGFKIDLTQGEYFVYVFIVDSGANNILDAEIFGIGFPKKEDTVKLGHDSAIIENSDQLNGIVNTSPIEVTGELPIYLEMLVIDTDRATFLPTTLRSLISKSN